MHPARGKPSTRWSRQIMREKTALQGMQYQSLAFGLAVFRLIVTALFTAGDIKPNLSTESYQNIFVCNFTIPIVLLLISYFLKKISGPVYFIRPFYDLNIHGGVGDNLKALTAIIALAHVLSVFFYKFWYILLILPLRVVYLTWKLFICPFLIMIFTGPESGHKGKNKKNKKKKGKKKIKYSRTITHWHNFR